MQKTKSAESKLLLLLKLAGNSFHRNVVIININYLSQPIRKKALLWIKLSSFQLFAETIFRCWIFNEETETATILVLLVRVTFLVAIKRIDYLSLDYSLLSRVLLVQKLKILSIGGVLGSTIIQNGT